VRLEILSYRQAFYRSERRALTKSLQERGDETFPA
jgi:hypothetical protein